MERGPLPIGTVLKARFTITRLIAGGGMAWVYQVDERNDDGSTRVWAMKELRLDNDNATALAEARGLFEQEAHILARLHHPNLPRVSAYFTEGGRSYLVMEFIPGESLKNRLKSANAPILESQVLDWALQICKVLGYLHSRTPPVIFRDMKPSNVMVTPDGRVKLIDFGIARTYKKGKLKDTLAMGSENYAAPEQWGKAQSDGRTDIYGLGATMYHLLTNVAPVPAFVPTPSPPVSSYNPALSEGVSAVLAKAMSPKPEERYQSAAEMREALVACLPAHRRQAQREGIAAPAPPAPRPRHEASGPPKVCPACQATNPAIARFCRRCGQSLVGSRPAYVRITRPPGVTWDMPVRAKSLLLGRQIAPETPVPYLDLGFYDPHGFLSRRHAVIIRNGDGYGLSDLGSDNGSAINGVRLEPRQIRPLHHNDEIQLGHIRLRFELR